MTDTPISLASFTPPAGTRLLVVGGCGGMGRALVQAARALSMRVAVLDIPAALQQFPPPDDVMTIACDVGQED